MRGDVAIHAVIRVLVPDVTGTSPEEMVLSALAKAHLVSDLLLPDALPAVKYEIIQRREGGQEVERKVLIDADHLEKIAVETDAGAGFFDLLTFTGEDILPLPPQPVHYPSPPIVLN